MALALPARVRYSEVLVHLALTKGAKAMQAYITTAFGRKVPVTIMDEDKGQSWIVTATSPDTVLVVSTKSLDYTYQPPADRAATEDFNKEWAAAKVEIANEEARREAEAFLADARTWGRR